MTSLFYEQPFTLKVILVLIAGVVLLRLAGKRSISQLTVPEVVLMIAVGTLLVEPVTTENEWVAIYGSLILVGGMMLVAYVQIRFPFVRKWIIGVPSILIRDGQVDFKELKKVQMNMDELEMRVRGLQIASISDVKTAVLELSGELSVMPHEERRPAEKADIQHVLTQLELVRHELAVLKKLRLMPIHESSFTATDVTGPTDPKHSSLFSEAILEDKLDQNITRQ